MRVDRESLTPKKSKTLRIALWILAIVTIAISIWFFGFRDSKKTVEYMSVPIAKQDLVVAIQATGNLEPVQSVSVGIEVSGTLAEVLADYNDPVKKQQVLARLDTTKLEASLKSAKGSLSVAKASLLQQEVALKESKRAKARLDEIYRSTDGAFPSQKEIENAEATYDQALALVASAKARLDQASADYENAEENLKKAVVLSPIDGIVLDRAVEAGQTVVATMQTPTLFTLAEDLKKMQVVVAVDEADVGEVREGQPVEFTVATYPDKLFVGKVKQVRLGSEIVGGVVTYNTVVEVDNSDLLLRPGMTAQASIITKKIAGALVVPNVAFRFSPPAPKASTPKMAGVPSAMRTRSNTQQGDKVYILQDGEPRLIRVKKGDTDGLFSAVNHEELQEGVLVITGVKQQ